MEKKRDEIKWLTNNGRDTNFIYIYPKKSFIYIFIYLKFCFQTLWLTEVWD